MRVNIIGGVQARDDNGAIIDLQPKTQAALVVFILSDAAISANRLAEFLWPPDKPPEEPPRDVHKASVDQISKLLHANLITRLEGRPGGRHSYRTTLTKMDYVDIDDFRETVKRAEAIPPKYLWSKCSAYKAALNLWADPPLADLPDTPEMNRLLRRIRDERLDAVEEWAKAMLQAGRHKALTLDLPALVDANPKREFLLGYLMRALYLAGRPSEARDRYRELRRRLNAESGAEPCKELQILFEHILTGSPSLKPTPGPFSEVDLEMSVMTTNGEAHTIKTSLDPDQMPQIDTTVPHSARIWNYMLGGKDNFSADRQAGDRIREIYPGVVDMTRQSRYMLARVVRYLAGEAKIRQFLDIGTGLPTADNTHEVAQRIAPESRIVYVDNDPLVLVHARALLTSAPEGATAYIEADARDPDAILSEAARTLDFAQPTALMLMGILGLVNDYGEARSIVERLMEALPANSYIALYDGADTDPAYVEAIRHFNEASGAIPYTPRSPEQIMRFFDGLELLEPGVVSVSRWRPESDPEEPPPEVACVGGVGRSHGDLT